MKELVRYCYYGYSKVKEVVRDYYEVKVAVMGMSLKARAAEISFQNMCCQVLRRAFGCFSIVHFLTSTGVEQSPSKICFILIFESSATLTKIYLNHTDNILFRLSTVITILDSSVNLECRSNVQGFCSIQDVALREILLRVSIVKMFPCYLHRPWDLC